MKSKKNNIYTHAVLISTGDSIITNRYIIIVQMHPKSVIYEYWKLKAEKSDIIFFSF